MAVAGNLPSVPQLSGFVGGAKFGWCPRLIISPALFTTPMETKFKKSEGSSITPFLLGDIETVIGVPVIS